MTWDVVEVRAEADCSLWVRFVDGTAGYYQLDWEELTGVLEPLRDAAFFRQVFVDHGAVAWPGEIDLAPDAMYREVLAASTPARIESAPQSGERVVELR